MTKKYPYLLFFITLLLILFFLKIDYRYKADWTCCSDEFDYYAHIKTIIDDRDLDYTNQFGEFRDVRNNINNKPTPIGFVGTSILSLPFYFLGKISNIFFDNKSNLLNNYEIALTSLSSTFYLFLTFLLFIQISNLINKKNHTEILLLLFGSGVTYYAFERYLMPHVFEIFTITLVFYVSLKFINTEEKRFLIILPYAMLLALLVRWTNYHVLLIPTIVKFLFFEDKKLKNYKRLLLLNSIFSIMLFFIINKMIYGIYTINPLKIYSSNSSKVEIFLSTVILDPFNSIMQTLNSFFLILFGPEFGIFWFSPILFVGILRIFFVKGKKTLISLIMICYIYQFSIVIMWGTAASSYGLRYLFSLIPLSYVLFLYPGRIPLEKPYIYIFSIFAFCSTLFFETTEGTQLSIVNKYNSFGNLTKYTQPDYLYGFFEALIQIDAWIIIFATSLLFSIFLKFLFLFVNPTLLISQFANFGLPVENTDFQNLIVNIQNTPLSIYIIYILFSSMLVLVYLKYFHIYKEKNY